VGSKEVANEVLRLLKKADITAEGVERGLFLARMLHFPRQHWISFECKLSHTALEASPDAVQGGSERSAKIVEKSRYHGGGRGARTGPRRLG
jgi:hypothetical protein